MVEVNTVSNGKNIITLYNTTFDANKRFTKEKKLTIKKRNIIKTVFCAGRFANIKMEDFLSLKRIILFYIFTSLKYRTDKMSTKTNIFKPVSNCNKQKNIRNP